MVAAFLPRPFVRLSLWSACAKSRSFTMRIECRRLVRFRFNAAQVLNDTRFCSEELERFRLVFPAQFHILVCSRMRLLNTESFEVKEVGAEIPDYVILSHRWHDEEITLADLRNYPLDSEANRRKAGYSKIKGACRRAKEDDYEWIWIDTCCIDRSSSAELQEELNAMWSHYQKANICYAYLVDVESQEEFSQSSWWKRGWTLQELLAPDCVEFYAGDWTPIGTKLSRRDEISSITNIRIDIVALKSSIGECCAAERFSWAAHRRVTREEDEAYSLLGIFQVKMSLIYGEGRIRAFYRLQEAIFAATGDFSLFLYRYSPFPDEQPLLADCSARFCPLRQCKDCEKDCKTCFSKDIPYAHLRFGIGWFTQAHDNIHASLTETHHVFSGTLFLLKYSHLASEIPFGVDAHQMVSHIAILNCTLKGEDHQKSVFCVPLQLSEKYLLDNFKRQSYSPILVPWNLVEKRQLQRVICCPEALNFDTNKEVLVTFDMTSKDCEDCRWVLSMYDESMSEIDEPRRSITIEATKYPQPNQSPSHHVECTFRYGVSRRRIRIRLEQNDYCWLITRVVEVGGKAKWVLLDRVTFILSNGVIVLISIRRLKAEQHKQTPRLRYAIAVEEKS